MRVTATALAVCALAGATCRMLPKQLSALPLVPLVVAMTPVFALLAGVALVLTLLPRAWAGHRAARLLVRAAAVVVLALEATWLAPYALPAQRVSDARQDAGDATTLTVMTCNVYKGAADPAAIVAAVRENRVEVLALQETTVDFVARLRAAGLDELLPHSQRSSSDGVYGNGVWSAYPLADVASDDIGSSASAMPAGTIEVTRADGTNARVRLVSVHTCSPGPGYWNLWRRSIEEIGVVRSRVTADPTCAYVLMGDFNATWDHAPFRAMLGVDETGAGGAGPAGTTDAAATDAEKGVGNNAAHAGQDATGGSVTLHDAAHECGQRLIATWPSNALVAPLVGIDHVVTSDAAVATSVQTLAIPGSDHAALLATLALS